MDKLNDGIIKTRLDGLANIRSKFDMLNQQKQAVIDAILTPEIKAQLAEIDAEFAPFEAEINSQIAEIETSIKQAVVEHGATVKGHWFQAVYAKGRVNWDTKALDGYAISKPELLAFRKEGEPSVSIRQVK